MSAVLPRIQKASITKEVEMSVRFIESDAERDVGCPRDVEILSVIVFGVSVPVDKATYEAIRAELLED